MDTFRGKVAVVTGGAHGIGRALAERFAAEGMRIVLADLDVPAMNAVADALRHDGAEVLAVPTDVSKPDQVQALADRAFAHFGAVHILCNNAGVTVSKYALAWAIPDDDLDWLLSVNLLGVIYGARAFVPKLLKQAEPAHIINTASVAGLITGASAASYTTSKYGVVGFSELLQYDLIVHAKSEIRVSILCPGMTNTDILYAERYRPGGARLPDEGTPEKERIDAVKRLFETGMPPAQTAGIVMEALREKRFFILTHPQHNAQLSIRTAAILSGVLPPALDSPAPEPPAPEDPASENAGPEDPGPAGASG